MMGTFLRDGSATKGYGLGAPTAQKKSACRPCVSGGRPKKFTASSLTCSRDRASKIKNVIPEKSSCSIGGKSRFLKSPYARGPLSACRNVIPDVSCCEKKSESVGE